MKKILAIAGALAIAALVAPAFMAFEAHVVNVTATIENALSVPITPITFGTVFPQEQLEKPLSVALSSSFLTENRVDDVEYFIRQKPKCGVTRSTNEGGTELVGPTWTGHVVVVGGDTQAYTSYVDCEKDRPADVTPQPNDLDFYLLPSLCQYISKHPDGVDNDTDQATTIGANNDGSLNSFHQPYTISATGTIVWNDTKGRLAKSEFDTTDTWKIDLKVPCFGGFCAQDWATFVRGINPDANPADYTQPIANEHKVFGCNLWVEVKGVSEVQEVVRPTVGALLSAYVAPTTCDITVDDSFSVDTSNQFNTIQEGVDAAIAGQTVCVKAGTYTQDVNINKSLTLVGDGSALTSLTGVGTGFGGALTVAAGVDNVTIEGFTVNGTGESAVYLINNNNNIDVLYNRIISATAKNALLTGGQQTNSTLSNNVFEGNAAGSQLVYVNGAASLGIANASDNVDFLNNTFGGSGNLALGQEAGNSAVNLNKFSTVTSFTDVEDWEGGNAYNQNNFNDGGLNLQHSENGSTGDNGITNAENNWWGDANPSDGDVNANVDVDFTPFEASAFPQN